MGTVSEGANRTVVLRTLDGQEVVTDALGQRWSEQELAQAQQATAALSLVSSVMALQQWGEMNDAQRLQSLAGLYNQIDGLSTGQLPGDLGKGVGVLGGAMGLYYGLRNDNALQAISGGVQLVNALSNDAANTSGYLKTA